MLDVGFTKMLESPSSDSTNNDVVQTLIQARHRHDYSSRDIANSLKVSSLLIEQLEQGMFNKLHGEVFVKSYLKAYAELVGLDGLAINQQYMTEQASINAKRLIDSNESEQTIGIKKKPMLIVGKAFKAKKSKAGLNICLIGVLFILTVLLLPRTASMVSDQAFYPMQPQHKTAMVLSPSRSKTLKQNE